MDPINLRAETKKLLEENIWVNFMSSDLEFQI